MYKSKKYNTVLVCLIFIISLVVGISAGMTSSGDFFTDTPVSQIEEPTDQETGTDLPAGLKRPSADAKPMAKLEFALAILDKGAGYKSQSTQELRIKALGATQKMSFKKYRGGGLNLVEEFFLPPSGFLSSSGKNGARIQYSDGQNLYVKHITSSGHFNYDQRTYSYDYFDEKEVVPYSEYLQTRFGLNDFFVNVDKDSVGSILQDKTSDPKNYIIKVNLSVNKLSPKYIATFTANGGGAVTIHSIQLTFKISKDTMFLTSVEKNEIFTATYAGFASSECQTVLKETFLAMNASQENAIKNIVAQNKGLSN